ncbi:hypothetical protein NE237_025999 [Protea cynaroides]|uniref:Uncharacterized protein n=1 Tax=Protea cynaroides TaxID=273540 RepID=A0A9Q0H3E8_9MAGN|nr:hypothetical protein NE237_025999 [Protea cynaroides]
MPTSRHPLSSFPASRVLSSNCITCLNPTSKPSPLPYLLSRRAPSAPPSAIRTANNQQTLYRDTRRIFQKSNEIFNIVISYIYRDVEFGIVVGVRVGGANKEKMGNGRVSFSATFDVVLLGLILNSSALHCNGGITSSFVRVSSPSVDMPFDYDPILIGDGNEFLEGLKARFHQDSLVKLEGNNV